MNKPFLGLVAAPFTPFHPNNDLNLDVIGPYAEYLKNQGVTAAFVCGTTGEGVSLTSRERMLVVERWIEKADRDFRIIVHTGHTCLEDACALAAHAAAAGAAAVSCMAPFFFRPEGTDDLVDWCEKVARAAAPLPFYFYHIPSMSGVALPMSEFLEQAAARIPTLAGIKYTHEDIGDYERCVGFLEKRFDILFGRDELLLEGLAHGARGAVGSTYNYAAPIYLNLINAYKIGNVAEARRMQDRSIDMIKICCNTGVTHLAASKTIMSMLGIDCGPVRPPLKTLSSAQIATLREKLEGIGIIEALPSR